MSNLLKALAVTAELTGTDWSKPAIEVIERELSSYPEESVFLALRRCQNEVRYKLTLADILDRLPGQHPGAEEAWSIVSKAMGNEQVSIVWTDPMRKAYGVAAPLTDDPVAARMAFKEKYEDLVSMARAERVSPKWSVSLGYDRNMREDAIKEAEQKNLLSHDQAQHLLRANGFQIEHAGVDIAKIGKVMP